MPTSPPAIATSFEDHLKQACALPLNMPEFLKGYAQCLAEFTKSHVFYVHDLELHAPKGVYPPHATSSTRFFMDHFEAMGLSSPRGRFLEIGCGAGGISLKAAQLGWDVTAVDINPDGVRATAENAKRNGLHVTTAVSDLFSAFGPDDAFDAIVFNEPFFHVEREVLPNEIALTANSSLHSRFMAEAAKHLAPGGRVCFAYSNFSDVECLNQPGWQMALRSFDFDAQSNYVRAHFVATPITPSE